MSDQNRISPYNINIKQTSDENKEKYQTSDENKEKYQLGDYKLIQSQIIQTNITKTVWQTERIITK